MNNISKTDVKRALALIAMVVMIFAVATMLLPSDESSADDGAGDLLLLDRGNGDTEWLPVSGGSTLADAIINTISGSSYSNGVLTIEGKSTTTIGSEDAIGSASVSGTTGVTVTSQWNTYIWDETSKEWKGADAGSAYTSGDIAVGFYPSDVKPSVNPLHPSAWTMIGADAENSFNQVAKLSPGDGEELWYVKSSPKSMYSAVLYVDGHVIVKLSTLGGAELKCYDDKGNEKWAYSKISSGMSGPVIIQDKVCVPYKNKIIGIPWADGPGDGDANVIESMEFPKTTVELSGSGYSGHVLDVNPVVDSGCIFTMHSNGMVYCLNANLELVWSYQSDTNFYMNSPTVIDGYVAVGGMYDGNLYILDKTSGKLLVKKEVYTESGNGSLSTPVLNRDGDNYTAFMRYTNNAGMSSSGGYAVVGFNTDKGELEVIKTFSVSRPSPWVSRYVSEDFSGALAGSSDGILKISSDGSYKKLNYDGKGIKGAVTVLNDEYLLFGIYSSPGTFHIADTDGNVIGVYEPQHKNYAMSNISVVDGMVFGGNDSGFTAYKGIYGYISASDVNLDKPRIIGFIGDENTINATIVPENATSKKIIWTSSDESVATVSADGLVTLISDGTATITASTVDGAAATCEVIVDSEHLAVESISLSRDSIDLAAGGETFGLKAFITPIGATYKDVFWGSSDESVATVSNDGVVTPVSVGFAVISATSIEGKVATCDVYVSVPVSEIVIDKTLTLDVEGHAILEAKVIPEDASVSDIKWSSSDDSVVKVSSRGGRVTAVSPGTATITATAVNGGVTATCDVTVLENYEYVFSIQLNNGVDSVEFTELEGQMSDVKNTASFVSCLKAALDAKGYTYEIADTGDIGSITADGATYQPSDTGVRPYYGFTVFYLDDDYSWKVSSTFDEATDFSIVFDQYMFSEPPSGDYIESGSGYWVLLPDHVAATLEDFTLSIQLNNGAVKVDYTELGTFNVFKDLEWMDKVNLALGEGNSLIMDDWGYDIGGITYNGVCYANTGYNNPYDLTIFYSDDDGATWDTEEYLDYSAHSNYCISFEMNHKDNPNDAENYVKKGYNKYVLLPGGTPLVGKEYDFYIQMSNAEKSTGHVKLETYVAYGSPTWIEIFKKVIKNEYGWRSNVTGGEGDILIKSVKLPISTFKTSEDGEVPFYGFAVYYKTAEGTWKTSTTYDESTTFYVVFDEYLYEDPADPDKYVESGKGYWTLLPQYNLELSIQLNDGTNKVDLVKLEGQKVNNLDRNSFLTALKAALDTAGYTYEIGVDGITSITVDGTTYKVSGTGENPFYGFTVYYYENDSGKWVGTSTYDESDTFCVVFDEYVYTNPSDDNYADSGKGYWTVAPGGKAAAYTEYTFSIQLNNGENKIPYTEFATVTVLENTEWIDAFKLALGSDYVVEASGNYLESITVGGIEYRSDEWGSDPCYDFSIYYKATDGSWKLTSNYDESDTFA